jgi:heptosyltransferase-2
MKILILALSGIGDALMFTPVLRLLRDSMPEAQIDALVMFKGTKDIYERNPDINNVLYFNFLKEGAFSSLRLVLSLRNKYDISFNVYPSNRKEYNIINYLIGAKKRAAAKYLRKDFQNLGFLNNVRIVEDDFRHNVKTNIMLCEKVLNREFKEEPPMNFYLDVEDTNRAADFLSSINIKENDLVVGFHPGTAVIKNHAKRRWEPEKFSRLAHLLIEKHKAKILIFGGADEKELKEQINNKINSSYSFIINTNSIAETAAIMQRCNVFVSNDSSLMHVASSLKLKVVAIIGPTNPYYIHPWKTEHRIVRLDLDCSPCFIYSPRPLICFRNDVLFKCIKELSVEMVYNTVLDFIN